MSKIGMVSKILKMNRGNWLTCKEISNYILEIYELNLNSRMVFKLIQELIDVGYVIQIKTVQHNSRIFCFEGIIL